ncbi:MAG: nucleotidyltransferase domain-containing protein [Paramuribaculum sp.]|nr:nucleotidyltransferase domain-containing protein [Paramuribaculum sp.]
MSEIDINKLRDYFSTTLVEKAWLFGSYARGEETTESDIDILISIPEGKNFSLLKHAEMMVELEDLVSRQVDIVRTGTIYPEIASKIEKDKILIYERVG